MVKVSNSFLIVLVLLSLLFVPVVYSQFSVLQTPNLRLIYFGDHVSYIIPHMGRCFENSLEFHRKLFDYTPSEEVTVYLHDVNDYGTGGTRSIPWNYLSIGIEPYDYAYETAPTNERMNWVMNHELAHVVDLDKPAGSDKFFRSLFFGKVSPVPEHPLSMIYSYFTSPRLYSPRWFHEGLAVFLETWMAGGIGRTLGGYDEMAFRTMVRDSSYFYDFVGLESEGKTIDFQIGANSYLYGTRFVSYLALHYGPEKVLQWMNRSEGSSMYFATQFEQVFGKPVDEEWSSWITFEHEWQKVNLDSIHQYTVTTERPLLQKALGSVSRAFYDSSEQKFYAAVNYPGELARAVEINPQTGKLNTICEIPTPALYYVASLAFDYSSKRLFYTTHNNSQWRDLNVVDVRTGNSSTLIKSGRIGDLAFNRVDKSLWGVRHHAGYSSLVQIPPPYTFALDVFTLLYGKDIYDVDISPDGKLLSASMAEISGRQRLIMMNIDSVLHSNYAYDVLYEFENNAPQNFVFSNDGKFLYGTTYFTGVSNVVRYNIVQRKMEWLSNCETGYFRPLPLSDDSLMVFRFTGKGFLPVIIPIEVREDVSAIKYLGQEVVDKHPIVKEWKVGSPLSVNIDSLTTYSGAYYPLGSINLASLYPIVQGYKDLVAYGLCLNLEDPLGLHTISLVGSYSPYPSLPNEERLHASLDYRFWQWKLSAGYNRADFYDLFGPTKTSRKGYSLSLSYSDFLNNDKPASLEYTLSASGYGGLQRLPDYQNVSTSFDKFFTFGGRLNYKYLLRTLGSFEYERGVKWSLHSANTYVRSKLFPKVYSNFEYGIPLPIDHSSIWLRGSVGYSPGDVNESFANFYFGGFGNNWVDYQEAQRYREYYSFPGVELNEIGGTKFGKAMIEWVLPPLRFRRFGIPNFYCTWARFAFFSSVITTNHDDITRRELLNIGSQVDFRFIMFTGLETTLSFGYAAAWERYQRPTDEFMISLKIL